MISPEQFEHHGIRHPVHHLREGSSCLAAGVAFGEFKDQVLDRLTSYAHGSVIKGDNNSVESPVPAALENQPLKDVSLRHGLEGDGWVGCLKGTAIVQCL